MESHEQEPLPQEEESLFSLTRSPYLNEVLKAAELLYYEEVCPDVRVNDLKDALEIYKNVVAKLSEVYSNLRPVQEQTEGIVQCNSIIEESFQRLHEGFELCESAFSKKPDIEGLVNGLSLIRLATEELFSAFDSLRDQELSLPSHSSSPFFHELLRIAHGVARGDFPQEALREQLAFMKDLWERHYREFLVYKGEKFESPEIASRIEELESAYEQCGEGFQQMERYLESGVRDQLEQGIALVKESSDKLLEIQDVVQRAVEEASTKSCLYCGAKNDLYAKNCEECQAMFHTYTPQEEPSSEVDLRIGEQVTSNERLIATNIIKLMEVVTSLTQGSGSTEELANTLNWLWDKIQQGKAQLERMKVPDDHPDEEEKELLIRSYEILSGGIQKLEAAISELGQFPEDGNAEHLTSGLDMALAGNDDVSEVQQISQKIWERRQQLSQQATQ
ncbi:MAG: hypothetical protein RDV48_13585 [Candidatus Eremiobacteraeota bacterium]|nr:hypothetical protein [Candidatus Eremiobacteraeota bacterium]